MSIKMHTLRTALFTLLASAFFAGTLKAEEVYRDNHVRFTLIDEGTIRLEYAPDGKFVDNKSFVAVIREYDNVPHKASLAVSSNLLTRRMARH